MHKCEARQSVGRGVILMAFLAVALAACDADEDSGSSAFHRSGAAGETSPPPSPLPSPSSGSASLQWLAPTTATDGSALSHLVGYRIYYGTDVNQLNETIELSNPGVLTYVVEDLPPGTYYFAVTAFNATGESTRSNAGRKIIT
jgi:Fibronectin type III domain